MVPRSMSSIPCPTCHSSLSYVHQYGQYYCYRCRSYYSLQQSTPSSGGLVCSYHPNAPGIGMCINCKNSICGACAIKYEGKLYCHNCVEKRKVFVPIPVGEPNLSYFKMGVLGSMGSSLLFIVIGFYSLIGMSPILSDHPMLGFFSVFAVLFILLFCFGLYGLYVNYGCETGKTGAISSIIFSLLFVMLSFWAIFSSDMFFSIITSISLGITLISIAATMANGRRYVQVIKSSGYAASTLLMMSGVFFIIIIGIFGFGWFIAAAGFLCSTAFFFKAPLLYKENIIGSHDSVQESKPSRYIVDSGQRYPLAYEHNLSVTPTPIIEYQQHPSGSERLPLPPIEQLARSISEPRPESSDIPCTQIVFRCKKCGSAYIEGGKCPYCN